MTSLNVWAWAVFALVRYMLRLFLYTIHAFLIYFTKKKISILFEWSLQRWIQIVNHTIFSFFSSPFFRFILIVGNCWLQWIDQSLLLSKCYKVMVNYVLDSLPLFPLNAVNEKQKSSAWDDFSIKDKHMSDLRWHLWPTDALHYALVAFFSTWIPSSLESKLKKKVEEVSWSCNPNQVPLWFYSR